MDEAIAVLKQQGAVIVDPADIPSVVDHRSEEQLPAVEHLLRAPTTRAGKDDDCSIVFKYGMKRDFNAWLASLGPAAPVKTLTELRDWNIAHTNAGAIKYGQSQLDISDEMDLEQRSRALRGRSREGPSARRRARHRRGDEGRSSSTRCSSPAPSGAAHRRASPGYPTVIVPFALVPNAPTPRRSRRLRRQAGALRRQLHRHGLQRAAAHRARVRVRAGDKKARRAAAVSLKALRVPGASCQGPGASRCLVPGAVVRGAWCIGAGC